MPDAVTAAPIPVTPAAGSATSAAAGAGGAASVARAADRSAAPAAPAALAARDLRALAAWIGSRHAGNAYVAYHAPRYARLLALLDELLPPRPRPSILEVGRSYVTPAMAEALGCRIDSLGLHAEQEHADWRHYHFDLNDCQHSDRCRRDVPLYPAIVMAEVIEHVHTSPRLVLDWLRTLLQPRGLLFLQTPNAVALHRRVRMLLGQNPYELIREDALRPGHFREYTQGELYAYAEGSGYDVVAFHADAYFDYRYRGHAPGRTAVPPRRLSSLLIDTMFALCPPRLKPGFTLVLQAR